MNADVRLENGAHRISEISDFESHDEYAPAVSNEPQVVDTESENKREVLTEIDKVKDALRESEAKNNELSDQKKLTSLETIKKHRRYKQMIKTRDDEIQKLRDALQKAIIHRDSVTGEIIEISKLRDDLESKSSVIQSMESSQKTMTDLHADKNAVINSQQHY